MMKAYQMKNYMACEYCRKWNASKTMRIVDNLLYCNKCIKLIFKLKSEGLC